MQRKIIWGLAGVLLTSAVTGQAATPARQRILLDADWRFQANALPRLINGVAITQWRWKADDAGRTDAATNAAPDLDTSGAGWQDTTVGNDVFKGREGYAWYRATLPPVAGARPVIHFESVDDNAWVYLNGQKVAEHEGWNDPFDVSLGAAWHADGPNQLAVLVQNNNGPGGIAGTVTLGTDASKNTLANDLANPGFNDRRWRTVHLPHDFVVEGQFDPTGPTNHGSLPVGTAWYRKTFTLPATDKGKSVWIDFDGIYRDSTAYLNGQQLGEHKSGYTSFRYDISKVAHYGGKNVLAVYVNPRHFEGWWYEGGGIYRHVWLNVANAVHVAPWGTFVSSKLPEPGADGVAAPAQVSIQTTIANDGSAAAPCRVVSQVADDSGKSVGAISIVNIPAGQSQQVTQQVTITNPRLWSLETPRLYHVVTTIQRNGQIIDTHTTPFGIRTLRYDANQGFFLNGKHVELKGTCNHQDFAGVGIGMPDSLLYWRIKKLKEMGCNAYRMSHNPPAPELLDACDRLGMLVMDENRHLGDTYSDHSPPGTPYSDLSDLASMILRDRNHPSIIMWSMCNEEGLQSTEEGARIFAAMKDVVHRYDTTRPISCAMNGGWGQGITNVEDLQGVNYSPGEYYPFHQSHPDMPMFGSETASTVTTRGIYADDKEKGYVSSYNLTDGSWQPVAERPFMAGSFAWTGFDYKGEPSPYGWPCINSHFGIMDMCGFPKDNYYYYQSWWGDKPIVHLMPHWNWPGKEGQNVRVVCFSNCARVELSLNGTSLGSKDMPRNGHLEWNVAYAPGSLTAKGYNGNDLAASDMVATTGPPAALRLHTDRTTLAPDGEDVTMIDVAVLDAQGHVVPTANNLVAFTLKGAGHIAGVGNGNPSDHDPDKADYRRAFNGLCMAIIQANEQPGAMELTATSPGLQGAKLSLRAK